MHIVQISDLHIGGLFKQNAFDDIVNEINSELKPNAIIISGDLVDEGIIYQYEKAQKEIQRFDCPNIIILPGNHDYRHTGYLLFKKFFPSTSKHVWELDNGNIVIFTIGTARPDRDEGEVGHRQILWMEKTMSNYSEEIRGRKRLKIVAMHHHLVAIPDTGYTNLVGVLDAGDMLRACLESGVDLVVCGHKHRPWMWNLGRLQIAYAGTACSWRYRGIFQDTYNIIDIDKKGEIKLDLKIVGQKAKVPLSNIVKKYKQEQSLRDLYK
jgi:3',5'-cyclic-AMP phosphodiesterase